MILITGAGGKTGRAVIKSLSGVKRVRAFVYHEELVAGLRVSGADDFVVGDIRDLATVRSALQGARSVYHICPNMNPDEADIGGLVIEEARKANVEHFVYHSVLHPQAEKMNHHWQKLRVEETLFESGLPFTILHPAPYMQNWSSGWRSIVEQGVLRVPYSVEARFSFVDLEDVAEAARIVLTGANHLYAAYELAGTTPLSHVEVAEILSRVSSREVRAEREEIGDWRSRVSGLSEYALKTLIAMFEYYDQWGLVGNPNVLTWLLRREPRTVESLIRQLITEVNA